MVDMNNFWYLFAGYTAIMAFIFIYVVRTFRAQQRVQEDIERLKSTTTKP